MTRTEDTARPVTVTADVEFTFWWRPGTSGVIGFRLRLQRSSALALEPVQQNPTW
jgi:hypothetical protein